MNGIEFTFTKKLKKKKRKHSINFSVLYFNLKFSSPYKNTFYKTNVSKEQILHMDTDNTTNRFLFMKRKHQGT